MTTSTAQSPTSHAATRNTAVAAARRRHPTARSAGRTPTLRRRMAAMLRAGGAKHPDVAVAVLEARGRLGLTRETFATNLELSVGLITDAEAGNMAAEVLPPVLAALAERVAV